jgi:hypothetical protein
MARAAALARGAAVAAALLAAAAAAAQDRPSEEELFGAPAAEAPPPESGASRERGAGRPDEAAPPRDGLEAELFGAQGSPNALPPPPEGIVPKDRDDPLRLGGQLYLRAVSTWNDGVDPGDWTLAAPSLLDVYLDARPNERVRAFALGRMAYDATLEGVDAALPAAADPALEDFFRAQSGGNPDAMLDQLWVNFDVGRRVFVTAGRQHVKWGVGRFWNPTDYLHAAPRDPLAVFDRRTGTTLVKLHLPWEARGWNAYGILALEDTGAGPRPTRRLGALGAGGRAEVVLGTVELGADALVRDGREPRFGLDVSLGVWELDLYAEAALRSGGTVERWRLAPGPAPTLERIDHDGLTPQVVAGATWSAKYSDEDVVTVGAEWFWDDTGYRDAAIYPYLLAVPSLQPGAPSPFSPFYLGRHQAALFATLPAPGSWNDTTFTLSALGNLSDRSFVVRLDHSVLALTYLRVETFVAGHLGERGGVYRFALDPAFLSAVPAEQREALGPIDRPPVLDVGVALRVSL